MKNIKRTNDLTGKRFGKLVVVGLDDKGTRKTYWVCQCDCGNIKSVRSDSLQCGAIKSCGCRLPHTREWIEISLIFNVLFVIKVSPSHEGVD